MDANRYSRMGLESVILSVGAGLAFAGLLPALLRHVEAEARELSEAPGTGLLFLLAVTALLVVDLLGLTLGVAGMVRRRRGRFLAVVGSVVSVLVLVFVVQGLSWEVFAADRGGTTVESPSR